MILIYTRLVGQTFEKPTETSVGFLFSAKQALCNQQIEIAHLPLGDPLTDLTANGFLGYSTRYGAAVVSTLHKHVHD